MVEVDPSLQLSLSCCFELGRAIRSGDADTFCEIYDSLLRSEDMDDSGNFQFKVSVIKEAARQISELDQEDYITLGCGYMPSIPSNDLSLDIYEPIAIQLAAIIDQLRTEGQGGVSTSDSGALSDYESSLCETDELKSGCGSVVTLCDDETENEDSGSMSDKAVSDIKSPEVEAIVEDTSFVTNNNRSIPKGWSTKADINDIAKVVNSDRKISKGGWSSVNSKKANITEASSIEGSTSKRYKEDANTPGEKESLNAFWSKMKDAGQESEPEVPPVKLETTVKTDYKESNNTEIITVTDLEKEFFSDSSEDVSPEKAATGKQSPHLSSPNKPDMQKERRRAPSDKEKGAGRTTREESKWQRDGSTFSRYGSRHYTKRGQHNSSYRHKGRGGYRSHYGREQYRTKENNSTFKNNSWASRKSEESEPTACVCRNSEDTDTARAHRDKYSGENGSKLGSAAECPEKKIKYGVATSQHPSPLVVHSQNMWSANIDSIKSCNSNKNVVTYKQQQQSKPFNHYEVGCFLMEGWEQVLKELTIS